MMMEIQTKHPASTRDFQIPWSGMLNGATISASTFTVSPSGLTISNASFSPTSTKIRTAGGVDGSAYDITNTVTLSDGQIMTFVLRIMVTTLAA